MLLYIISFSVNDKKISISRKKSVAVKNIKHKAMEINVTLRNVQQKNKKNGFIMFYFRMKIRNYGLQSSNITRKKW